MRTHEKSSELGEQRQAIQRQEDREAAEAKARRSQQSRVQHQRDTEAKGRQDQARRLMEKQLHLQAQAAQASAAVRAEKSATASGRLMSSLKSRLQGPAALRELMVLKEIIDPPVSQRELRH